MFDDRTNLTRQVAADLREFFGNDVLQTVIPRSVRLAEAPSHGKPIVTYDVRSRGAESYIQLAKEILDRDHANTKIRAKHWVEGSERCFRRGRWLRRSDAGSGTGTFGRIAIEIIDPNPVQPRRVFQQDALHQLADSIRQHGIIQPLVIGEWR